jgi:hypothetical protein
MGLAVLLQGSKAGSAASVLLRSRVAADVGVLVGAKRAAAAADTASSPEAY